MRLKGPLIFFFSDLSPPHAKPLSLCLSHIQTVSSLLDRHYFAFRVPYSGFHIPLSKRDKSGVAGKKKSTEPEDSHAAERAEVRECEPTAVLECAVTTSNDRSEVRRTMHQKQLVRCMEDWGGERERGREEGGGGGCGRATPTPQSAVWDAGGEASQRRVCRSQSQGRVLD
jgi:hypothetical protein